MIDFLAGFAPLGEMSPPNSGTSCFVPLLSSTPVSNQICYSGKPFKQGVASSGSLGSIIDMDRR